MEEYKIYLKNNNIKISDPTWNDELNLFDESYSMSDILQYFEYISKKHETIANNPPIEIYVNKIKNYAAFKIKTDYKLELLSEETKRMLGSTKQDADKDKNAENIQN